MILTILRILYLRLRNNPLELLLVFVMPVIFFSIFAAIFSNGIATGGDKKLRVGWISNRDTALGFQLLGFLEQNSSLICTRLNSSADETTSDAITSDPTIADQTTSDQLVSDQPALDQTNSEAPANQTADEVDLNDSDSDSVLDDATIESKISDAQKSGRYDLIIRLPADFPNRLVEVSDNEDQPVCQVSLVTDGQNPMAVSMVTSIVKGFFAQKRAAVAAEQLMSLRTSSGLAADVDVPGAGDRPVPPQAMVPGSAVSGNRPQFFDAAKEPTDVFVNDKNADWIQTNPDGVNSVNGQEGVPSEWAIAPDKPPSENPTQLLETALADKAGSENDDASTLAWKIRRRPVRRILASRCTLLVSRFCFCCFLRLAMRRLCWKRPSPELWIEFLSAKRDCFTSSPASGWEFYCWAVCRLPSCSCGPKWPSRFSLANT